LHDKINKVIAAVNQFTEFILCHLAEKLPRLL
jgi:hypothetical protein